MAGKPLSRFGSDTSNSELELKAYKEYVVQMMFQATLMHTRLLLM